METVQIGIAASISLGLSIRVSLNLSITSGLRTVAAMEDRVESVCDLLMGAAYADESLHEKEKQAVEKYLKELLPNRKMTSELQKRIDSFDPDKFDLNAVASEFAGDGKSERLKLLDLVAAVHSADGEYDFAEDDYLHSVAKAMSLDEDDAKVHALVYEIETLKEHLASLRPPPPPPPS